MYDDINEEGFAYVVRKIKPAAICFGSKMHRDTNPIGKGLSSFQKRYGKAEIQTNLTPQTYNVEHLTSGIYILQNKVTSNRGTSGLASNAPRMKYQENRNPSPTRYELIPTRKIGKNKAPFNTKKVRLTSDILNLPGPGTYDTDLKRCRRTGLQYNFGNPTTEPAYEVECAYKPKNICVKCNTICNLDYWHQDHTIFLCHSCMEEEWAERQIYKTKDLKKFKRMRACTFVHDHKGTTAKIFLWERNQLAKKLRIENYLRKYLF